MKDSSESQLPSSIRDERFLQFEAVVKELQTVDYELLSTINDIDTINASVLPHLAQQLNVWGLRGWFLADTVEKQRSLLKIAIELNQKSGTLWAVRNALEAVGYPNVIVEENPPLRFDGSAKFNGEERFAGRRLGGFIVHLDPERSEVGPDRARLIIALVNEWKAEARALLDVRIGDLSLFSNLLTYDGTIKYDGSHFYDGRLRVEGITDTTVTRNTQFGEAASAEDFGGEGSGNSERLGTETNVIPTTKRRTLYDLRQLSLQDIGADYDTEQYQLVRDPGAGLQIERVSNSQSWDTVSSVSLQGIHIPKKSNIRIDFSYEVTNEFYISSGFIGLAEAGQAIAQGPQHRMFNWLSVQTYPSSSNPKIIYSSYLAPGQEENRINHTDLVLAPRTNYGQILLSGSPSSDFKTMTLSSFNEQDQVTDQVRFSFNPATYGAVDQPNEIVPTFSCKQLIGLKIFLIEIEVETW